MTSRGPGWASRCPEMEEKEQLRRQIRLLQGLIDDYKNLHGTARAPCPSAASRWQPPAFTSSRSFSARYPRPSRRGFSPHHGPAWRKKYSLVNRPPGPAGPPSDQATQPPLGPGDSPGPDPRQYVLERQVQLSPDQNMVVKIKPPSKPGSGAVAGAPRGSGGEPEDAPWGDHRPQEGEGDPPGGKPQPSRPGRAKESASEGDPLVVCQKEPGRPRAAKSASAVSGSPPEPRRTVSESAITVKARGGAAAGRKAGAHSAGSCAAQLTGDGRASAGRPEQPAPADLVGGPARPTSGPRQAREASLLVSCRINKFRKNNYKWVAASAKSPRAARRALSPRVAAESVGRAPGGAAERAGRPQLRAEPDARPRKAAAGAKPGMAPSKYKWKASSPSASTSSSFHWRSEAGSKDQAAPLATVSRAPPEDTPAVGPSGLTPVFGEAPLSTYKVKSRTQIVRRRGSASLPGDKRTSPSAATPVKGHFGLRRRQTLRGKSSPVLKKTPGRGLVQVTRHRLCRLPPARALLPAKEAPSLHPLRTPPASKVIQTRYRLVKKTPASPLSGAPFPLPLPSWRTRGLTLSRSLVLNRPRPATSSAARAQPGPPQWRSRGYRCIGGVLYRVSANKLSRTSSDGASRAPPRTGRLDPASSGSRSLASRAVQRSLAIVRQAKQKKERRREEYCMYYNRFGRCSRGERCPYIHDPEKVAVCTRFLRGTCKKTDGTCPFSHHVSKDKMPVCSYFLKGTCSNSECPYSHVYVSRKAEVCSDFLKGYCPLGAKCKKKHTLLCPDFSRRGVCPRGTRCQLLHRSKKRPARRVATPPAPEPSDSSPRSRASTGHGPRKSSATQRPSRPTPGSPAAPASPARAPSASASASPLSSTAPSRSLSSCPSSPSPSPCPSPPVAASHREELALPEEEAAAGPGCSGLSKLPSFISLQSSPSPRGQPRARAPRSPPAKDSGKPLHIKPRL
ncbi:zinc finger CCCH domain-containing protein 3 [Dasypus novemcinctus]|uniref:zinc finger CCCH domain-containing protein 3 n=1 Tax=Dasypus novemcinctus TaxID=9361 RepID=UPI00265E8A36|nr:zinc finger CCCH domain-containing protein 3 [Dasypus novemcinctus]